MRHEKDWPMQKVVFILFDNVSKWRMKAQVSLFIMSSASRFTVIQKRRKKETLK